MCNNNKNLKELQNELQNKTRIINGDKETIKHLNNILDTIKNKPDILVYVRSKAKLDTIVKTRIIYDTNIVNNIIKVDTCYNFNYIDSFNYVSGLSCKDSTTLKIQTSTDVYFTFEDKSNMFKRKYEIYSNFTNPNIIVEDVGYSVLTPKQKRFGVGITCGVNTIGKSVLFLGIGITYNILLL